MGSITPVAVHPFKYFHDALALYSPTVALFGEDAKYLVSNNAIKRLTTRNAVDKAQLRPDILRWRVVTHTSNKLLPLASQRTRLRRRWSSAILASLATHGLDVRGKLHAKDKLSRTAGVTELGGTLEILVLKAAGWDMAPEKLQGEADKIISSLIRAGMHTRRITFDAIKQLEKSPPQQNLRPLTFRPEYRRRTVERDFNPSKHKPSWYRLNQNTWEASSKPSPTFTLGGTLPVGLEQGSYHVPFAHTVGSPASGG